MLSSIMMRLVTITFSSGLELTLLEPPSPSSSSCLREDGVPPVGSFDATQQLSVALPVTPSQAVCWENSHKVAESLQGIPKLKRWLRMRFRNDSSASHNPGVRLLPAQSCQFITDPGSRSQSPEIATNPRTTPLIVLLAKRQRVCPLP